LTRARNQQVSLDDTPYYHCISRCVRRAYLCGDDPQSGENFDHRKRWLVERIKSLASVFAIDVCAYAVMSNHYHLVLFVNQQTLSGWSDEEVIRQWTKLFPRNGAVLETPDNNSGSGLIAQKKQQTIALWRERLGDISWFMRCINETIARRANREDDCTGRFWEGRFKSQALLDEKAVISCMAYVDLNPVRAGITDSLDTADFTSIQERLVEIARRSRRRTYRQERLIKRRTVRHLMGQQTRRCKLKPLAHATQNTSIEFLPISRTDYVELLETTCRMICAEAEEKKRLLCELDQAEGVLTGIAVSAEAWLKQIQSLHRLYGLAVGSEAALRNFHRNRSRHGAELKHPDKWVRGLPAARQILAA